MVIVYFVVNAVFGALLPLSNDMMAAMSPQDQSAFMPLFLLTVFINTTVMYVGLTYLRYKGWKLFLAVWISFFGLFTVLNCVELFWYIESFPLFTPLDITKLMIIDLFKFGLLALVLVHTAYLVGGQDPQAGFLAGAPGTVYWDSGGMYPALGGDAWHGSLGSLY